jgi:hypothetical protein
MSNSELLGGGNRVNLVGGNLVLNGHGTSKSNAFNNVALGEEAGRLNMAGNSVAIGYGAGEVDMGSNAIAIGTGAGDMNQGDNSIALGSGAGTGGIGDYTIVIGNGLEAKGGDCIIMGGRAFNSDPTHSNNIIINASNGNITTVDTNRCYISPIRNNTGATPAGFKPLFYNPTTGELYCNTT